MRQAEFEAVVKDGHLPPDTRLRIADTIKKMDGKRIQVVIRQPRKRSSNPQRQYYFAVIVTAVMELFREHGTWVDKEEAHDWLMENVGKWFKEIKDPDGQNSKIRRSYTDLSTVEAEQHHLLCRQWGAEHGVNIQEPDES